MTIILNTETGTVVVTHTSNVQEAINYAEQFGHKCTGEYTVEADEVVFSWGFEDCGEEGVVKNITIDADGIDKASELVEAGESVPNCRKAAKKLAKKLNAKFTETTAAGTAQDYRLALIENSNSNR